MKLTLKRLLRAATAAAILAGGAAPSLAAEIPAFDANKKVTITYYNYNLASAGIGKEATELLISEFMAKYPNITVQGVPVPATEMTTRVQADIIAGRTPDVTQMIFNDLDHAVTNLGVQSLQDIIPAGEWREHTQGMVPAGLKLAAMNGKTYGIPYVFSTPVLFYNADLFRAAGLDPDKPPRTWAEIKAASLAIKQKTGKEGFGTAAYDQFDWLRQALILSNGGRTISEDRKRLMIGEEGAVGAYKMLRDLVESGAHTRSSAGDMADAMRSGSMGMYLQTSAYTRVLIGGAAGKWDLRAAKMPAFGDKPTQPTNSGSGLFIHAKDPAKQRAAWELMKYMTSERGYTVITEKIGYLPLRLNIVDDPQYLGNFVKQTPLIRPNLEQLANLKPWESLPGPNYKQIQRIEQAAVEQAVFGTGDVATIMMDAQKRAQALMPK